MIELNIDLYRGLFMINNMKDKDLKDTVQRYTNLADYYQKGCPFYPKREIMNYLVE